MSEDLVEKLEQMAFEHGRYFDSYIITEPNREYFWSMEDRGVIGFQIHGRHLNVASGLIVSPEFKQELIDQFLEFARLNNLTISFHCIDREEADFLQSNGFQVTKFGEETSIPLENWSWAGKKFEWVRRQANYVKRHQVEFEEVSRDNLSEEKWSRTMEELIHVADEYLSTKAQKGSIPLFEGQLIPEYLYRRRIFIARNQNENTGKRIEGFIICNPYQDGTKWGVEMYRQRTDAVRGTLPSLVFHTVNLLKEEGIETLSLSPIPALRCEKPLPNDSWLIRKMMTTWYNHSNYLFDVPGIFHFKSRFRPEFSDTFVCVYPKASIATVMGYARCAKVLDVKSGFIFKAIYKRLTKRKKLAEATQSAEKEHVSNNEKSAEIASERN